MAGSEQRAFFIGGKANYNDIYATFRAVGDALRDYFATQGPRPLFVVVGRGGPNLVPGMAYLRDILDALALPYRTFGHGSSTSGVVNYVRDLDEWMRRGGKEQIAARLGIRPN